MFSASFGEADYVAHALVLTPNLRSIIVIGKDISVFHEKKTFIENKKTYNNVN